MRPRYRATRDGFIPGHIRVTHGQEFETTEDVEPGFWWLPINQPAQDAYQARLDRKVEAGQKAEKPYRYQIPAYCRASGEDPLTRHVEPPPQSGMMMPAQSAMLVPKSDTTGYDSAPGGQYAEAATSPPRRRSAATV